VISADGLTRMAPNRKDTIMRTLLAAFAASVMILGASSESHAQYPVVEVVPRSAPIGGWLSVPYPGYPYNYYVAHPYPARDYVGYGTNDFPFYGRPYGKPTDRWTWPFLSGSEARTLARYYYPPVR
jgi:hypothetical protein